MKTDRKPSSLFFTALLFMFLLALSATAQTQEGLADSLGRDLPGTNPHGLIGTWAVNVTITNCSGAIQQQFSKLVSFNQGGTATEVSTGAPPSARTTALGIWEHNSQNSFRYALRFFVFTPGGVATSNAKWFVTMSEFNDSYTAEAQIQVVPPTGTPQNLCGTETATRFSPF